MKNPIAVLAFTAALASLVGGCATRTDMGPGDAMGADYAPVVTVVRRPILLDDVSSRRTGVDTYNAEKFAKTRSCAALPFANLIDKGPGFERYSVACNGGVTMAVRCEFGNCRAV